MPVRRTSSELRDLRARVRTLADAQHGVFRRSDLVAWGFEPSAALTMRRNGTWVRLHHGVYADRDTVMAAIDPVSRHALLAAATVAALPGDVALFGPSASMVLGVPLDRRLIGPVHLVRPRGSDSRALRRRISALEHLPDAIVHVLDTPAHLLSMESGLPIVVPELAACSTAMLSDPDWAVATLDAIAWQDPDALERLASVAELWPRLAGAGVLRQALPLVRTGAQTPLESLSRVRLVRQGLPEPALQVPIHGVDGLIGYVDMLFELLGVIGEADGALKYDDRRVLVHEKRREDQLRADGFGVVRWGWPEAMGSMRSVADQIRGASLYSRRRRAS
jgi:Transcriptional regulator, AbiEi antitoxin